VRAVRARDAVTACSPRAERRVGVLVGGAVAADRQQGVAGEHQWGPRGGAGQCGGRRGSLERWCSGEVGRGSVVAVVPVGGGTLVIGNDSSDVLQQGDALGEVRSELHRTRRLRR
jgi:hypothetical protein